MTDDEPLVGCWMCDLNLPHRVPGQCAPDQSSGWLRWLNGPTPEEWAAQYFVHPIVARPVVMPVAAMSEDYGVMRDDDGLLRFTEPQVRGTAPEPTPDGFLGTPENDLTVRKLSAVIEVPDELLMDYGVIPDTRPKPPPPTWRTRFRRKRAEWRDRAARRAYKVIAGDWPDDGTDW